MTENQYWIESLTKLDTIIALLEDQSKIDRIIELGFYMLGIQTIMLPFLIIGIFFLGVKNGNGN